MKRMFSLLLAVFLLTGCAGRINPPAPAESAAVQDVPAEAGDPAAPAVEESDEAALQFTGNEVCGVLQEAAPTYLVSAPNESALIAGASAVYTAERLSVDKSGDATDPAACFLAGTNAAVAAVHGGIATLGSATVTASGVAAHALYASGADSTITVGNAAIVVTGASASALFAADGGKIEIGGGELRGAAAPIVTVIGGTSQCTDASLVCDGSAAALLDARGGGLIRLIRCTAAGGLRFSEAGGTLECSGGSIRGDVVCSEDAEASLVLTEGASLTGALSGEFGLNVFLRLDAASSLTLTGDSYIAALTDDDASLKNIHSGGHSLYYNAEHEANAWLAGKTLSLDGGGYLIPMI